MGKLIIESDFSDYYDTASKDLDYSCNDLIYRRMAKESEQINKSLSKLATLSVKVADMRQVKDFIIDKPKDLVVYLNPKSHSIEDRTVCGFYDAYEMYPDSFAMPFIENVRTLTKFVQIGYKRLRMVYEYDSLKLACTRLISITELTPYMNFEIADSVFSIDYLEVDGKLTAVDYNGVQNLSKLGIQNYIQPYEICGELVRALYVRERNNMQKK